jgi:HNH endonuclease
MHLRKLPAKMYPGFGLSMLDRAVKEFFAARCGREELLRLTKHFVKDGAVYCVYCGTALATRWDHLHPVSKGGDSSPGNLVPACSRCDDSKQNKTIGEWAASKAKHRPTPARVKAIDARLKKYQKSFTYSAREFEEKLKPAQKSVYRRFRKRLDSLRAQMREDKLISR